MWLECLRIAYKKEYSYILVLSNPLDPFQEGLYCLLDPSCPLCPWGRFDLWGPLCPLDPLGLWDRFDPLDQWDRLDPLYPLDLWDRLDLWDPFREDLYYLLDLSCL